MDDLERTFREGLRDAAAKKPPLGPIDLDEVTTRPVDVPRRRPPRWLAAAAAAVVLVAGIGIGVWSLNGTGASVPAVPAFPAATPYAPSLVGTSWRATKVNGQPVVADANGEVPYLTFVDELHGVGGQPCNNMELNYEIDGTKLVFTGLSTHDTGCGSTRVAAQQERFSRALLDTESFRRSEDSLELLDRDTVVLTFVAGGTRLPDVAVARCKVTDVGSALHPNRVSVRVFDDGSIGGLSKVTTMYLRVHGFKVLDYGTTTNPIGSTTIRGTVADSPEVKLVQQFFPGSVAEADGRADHSVDVRTSTMFTDAAPTDASVPVSGPLCLPAITSNVQVGVEMRVRNDTNRDFSAAKVISLEDETVSFSRLTAGAVSKYQVVERAYPNALFVVETDGSPSPVIQPQDADYKTPRDSDLLAPGRYTYVITLDGAGRWGLRLEVDR